MQPKRKPRHPNGAAEKYLAPAEKEFIAPYDSDNPLEGYPALLEAPPTDLITLHAAFTAQHVINELRYRFEMGALTAGDKQMLAQLGKEVMDELDAET